MEKEFKFLSPKHLNLRNVTVENVSQIVYIITILDYSSCVDITAPDFWQYLKKALPPFVLKIFQVSFIVYLYWYRVKTTEQYILPLKGSGHYW